MSLTVLNIILRRRSRPLLEDNSNSHFHVPHPLPEVGKCHPSLLFLQKWKSSAMEEEKYDSFWSGSQLGGRLSFHDWTAAFHAYIHGNSYHILFVQSHPWHADRDHRDQTREAAWLSWGAFAVSFIACTATSTTGACCHCCIQCSAIEGIGHHSVNVRNAKGCKNCFKTLFQIWYLTDTQ